VIGAGTFINPLLKIVTTVAILGAVYLFIVKPVLDTTEEVSKGINNSVTQSFTQPQREAEHGLEAAGVSGSKAQRIADRANKRADKLVSCIQDAHGDVSAIQACGARFSP
jgi:F0F1-type ATP synthase membrane subunit b/b'